MFFTLFYLFSFTFIFDILLCVLSYMILSPWENPYFGKKFLDYTYFSSVRAFARIRQTISLLLKIFGGRIHGPSPQSPLGFRPCDKYRTQNICLHRLHLLV